MGRDEYSEAKTPGGPNIWQDHKGDGVCGDSSTHGRKQSVRLEGAD